MNEAQDKGCVLSLGKGTHWVVKGTPGTPQNLKPLCTSGLRFRLKGSVGVPSILGESGGAWGGGLHISPLLGGEGCAGVGLVKSPTEKLEPEALFQKAGNENTKGQSGVTPCQSRARTLKVTL